MPYLIPGELIPEDGFIELNKGREVTILSVKDYTYQLVPPLDLSQVIKEKLILFLTQESVKSLDSTVS